MVAVRVAEGPGVDVGGIGVIAGPDVAFGGKGVAVGRSVAVAGMIVMVGSSPEAGLGDRLLNSVAILADAEDARSDSSWPTCRQIWPAPDRPSGHVMSNIALAKPSIEMNTARMHATEDATIRRSLHPELSSRSEPVLMPDFPRPHSCL